jgi:excisionase family DNA binding protein
MNRSGVHGWNMPGFDLLTLREVAALLHCSRTHVSNVLAGRVRGCAPIPSVRLGRRMLIRREALLRWVEQNEQGGGNLESSPDKRSQSA